MEPVKGFLYRHKENVYRVEKISKGTNKVLLRNQSDGKNYTETYSLFDFAYERVVRVTEAARILHRHPRTIYRYETEGRINKPKCSLDLRGRMVRYYNKQDLLDMYDLLSDIHAGRPNKNNLIVNNSLPNKQEFKQIIKEKFT